MFDSCPWMVVPVRDYGLGEGIGRGIAEYLGQEGANVVINYRSSEGAAHDAVDAIESAGGFAVAGQGRRLQSPEVEHMVEICHEAFGPADAREQRRDHGRQEVHGDVPRGVGPRHGR